jgi:hypothetical protein
LDIAINGFNDAEPNLHPTVVENAIDMIGEHERQFVECGQALPAELKHPVLQDTVVSIGLCKLCSLSSHTTTAWLR